MSILGSLVLGASLGLLAQAIRRVGDLYDAVLTGALAAGFGAIVFVTMNQSEHASFFSAEGWLVGGTTAVVALMLRAVVAAPPTRKGHPR